MLISADLLRCEVRSSFNIHPPSFACFLLSVAMNRLGANLALISSAPAHEQTPKASSVLLETRSCSDKITAELIWTIEDLSFLREDTAPLHSEPYPVNELGYPDATEKWMIEFFPTYPTMEVKKDPAATYAGVFLMLQDVVQMPKVPVHYTLQVLVPATGKWENIGHPKHRLFDAKRQPNTKWGYDKAISHAELFSKHSKFLNNDALTLRAQFVFFPEHRKQIIRKSGNATVTVNPSKSLAALCARQAELCRSKEDSDYVLIASDKKEFPVHRVILRVHSSVFSAMLRHGRAEAKAGRCEILDVEGETLDALLEYLYGCSTEKMGMIAEKIMEAADKYEMEDLRDIAVDHLVRNIASQNAAKLLIAADRRGLDILEKAVVDFVALRMDEFMEGGGMEEGTNHSKALRTKL